MVCRRVKEAFGTFSELGRIVKPGFIECMTDMGLQYPAVADVLFDVFDKDKDGELSEDEFVDSFITLTSGSLNEKMKIAFQIHDVSGRGYIKHKALKTFFLSFFTDSLKKIDALAVGLDQLINGKQVSGQPTFYCCALCSVENSTASSAFIFTGCTCRCQPAGSLSQPMTAGRRAAVSAVEPLLQQRAPAGSHPQILPAQLVYGTARSLRASERPSLHKPPSWPTRWPST